MEARTGLPPGGVTICQATSCSMPALWSFQVTGVFQAKLDVGTVVFHTPMPSETINWLGTSGLNCIPPTAMNWFIVPARVSHGTSVEANCSAQLSPLQVAPPS